MRVIIGIIKNERDKVEACRIYDTALRSYEDISYGKIKNSIAEGQRIVGYRLNNSTSYMKENKRITALRKENASYNLNIVPKLNGSGKLINNEDNDVSTLIGWTGFAECKQYIVVNWDGTLTTLSQQEFKEKVQNRKINGARYNNICNKYCLTPDLNNELEFY